MDERNRGRLERMAEAGIDEAKLFTILQRLGLHELVRDNARDLLRRTTSPKLAGILRFLA